MFAELEALSKDIYVSPFHVATIYAGLNEPDLMFEWLERAYQVRARSLAWLHVTKEMKPFHADDQFQDLLMRIGIYSSSKQEYPTFTRTIRTRASISVTSEHET